VILEHFAAKRGRDRALQLRHDALGESQRQFLTGGDGIFTPDPGGNTWNLKASCIAREVEQSYLVSYMESHDEERLVYKNLQFGNSSGSYNTKELNTALKRIEQCAGFFLAAPGPKMIWQFGSWVMIIPSTLRGWINQHHCRLDKKPINGLPVSGTAEKII
jgi:hypothetical protein